MQLTPSSSGIPCDISQFVRAVSGLTVSYRRLLTLSYRAISEENREIDPKRVPHKQLPPPALGK